MSVLPCWPRFPCRWPSTQTTKSRIQLTQWWGYLQCQELNNVFIQQILYRARLKNVCNNFTWIDGVLTLTWLDLETMWLDYEIWKLFTLIIFGKIIFFRQACILFYLCGFPGLCTSLNSMIMICSQGGLAPSPQADCARETRDRRPQHCLWRSQLSNRQ